MDFTKVFDFLVRDVIWYKLIKYGVRSKLLNIIRSMYESVKIRVKYKNTVSEEYTCSLGVCQGESVSPFLFSMYLNDIEEHFMLKGYEGIDVGLLKLFLLLYADDIVIFSETEEGLRKGLLLLEEYCDRWRLTVNTDKTKVMIFKKGGRNRNDMNFCYKNKKIEIVKQFTYLGIKFTTGGSFHDTFEVLADQAVKAIYKLKHELIKFPTITVKHQLELFDKLIFPILNYGAVVWGLSDCQKIERIHLHFCKNLLGVKKQTQNDFIYGELGRTTLLNKRVIHVIKYWLKIVQLEDMKYVKCIYNMMKSDLDSYPNIKNWAKSVKDLLQALGFNEVWLNQGVGNMHCFMSILKQRNSDTFIQNWTARINNSTRARTYSLYASFRYQPYLNDVNVTKCRYAITKLRVSSHRLQIETGRWHKPTAVPYEERKCLFCEELEDEFHFILKCPLYTELRSKYIKKYYWNNANIPKFVELLSSANENLNKNLSVFIFKSFELRNNIYYDT